MFVVKKKYFLIIENTKDIDLKNIKVHNKFSIIYRNHKNQENLSNLIKFSQICRLKNIKFYVANDLTLATKIQSLLDPNGIERTVLFREFVADKIANAPHLYQPVKQAIKINSRFDKLDASIREKNAVRDGLISHGKRRIG